MDVSQRVEGARRRGKNLDDDPRIPRGEVIVVSGVAILTQVGPPDVSHRNTHRKIRSERLAAMVRQCNLDRGQCSAHEAIMAPLCPHRRHGLVRDQFLYQAPECSTLQRPVGRLVSY